MREGEGAIDRPRCAPTSTSLKRLTIADLLRRCEQDITPRKRGRGVRTFAHWAAARHRMPGLLPSPSCARVAVFDPNQQGASLSAAIFMSVTEVHYVHHPAGYDPISQPQQRPSNRFRRVGSVLHLGGRCHARRCSLGLVSRCQQLCGAWRTGAAVDVRLKDRSVWHLSWADPFGSGHMGASFAAVAAYANRDDLVRCIPIVESTFAKVGVSASAAAKSEVCHGSTRLTNIAAGAVLNSSARSPR